MGKIKKDNIKGQVIVLVALSLVALILIIGIAIDGGIGMAVDAKLSSAVDAAALAAGRALGEGGDDATKIANATAAASKFYYGNFPTGYLRATPLPPDIVVEKVIEDDGTWHGKWRVTVSGEATVPTFFLRIAGNKILTAKASAETLRRDLDMALIVDVSDSLSPVQDDVRDAVKNFVDEFNEGSDRMALISFATGAVVNVPIRTEDRGFDKGDCDNVTGQAGTICGEVDNLNFAGYTNFGEGFWNGKNQLDSIDPSKRSSLRVIVFFTDGSPNTFASRFTFTNPSGNPIGSIRTCKTDCEPRGLWRHDQIEQRYYPYFCYTVASCMEPVPQYYNAHGVDEYQLWPSRRGVSDGSVNYANINRISRNLPEDMADSARSEGIIVYTIGLQGSGCHMTGPSGPDGEIGQDILKRMANTQDSDTYNPAQPSGLFCLAETEPTGCPPATGPIYDLEGCFDAVASHILRLTK